MKTSIVAAGIMLVLAPFAHAQERVGTAALGALSGAVVLGPIGLVAGAVVGYTAGPEIGRAWKVRRVDDHGRAARSGKQGATRVAAARRSASPRNASPRAEKPAAGVVTPAPGVGGPAPQGLE